ncbi:MAG: hypothetical protein U0525_01195 [Patescibacteria group bacterium]
MAIDSFGAIFANIEVTSPTAGPTSLISGSTVMYFQVSVEADLL